MVLLGELLNMERSGATSTSLKHATSSEHGDDREHLGRSVQLEDGEEIGVIISKYVSSDGDGLFALCHSGARFFASRDGVGERNI